MPDWLSYLHFTKSKWNSSFYFLFFFYHLQAQDIPTSLSAALDALEKDEQMNKYLGDFVKIYATCKRDYEIGAFKQKEAELNTEEKQMQFERSLYLYNL